MSRPPGCEGVRTRLLEGVDLHEIREIERAHIEGCAGCRAALARVEAGMAALAVGIGAIETRLSADEAVALATGVAAGPAGGRMRGSRTGRALPRPDGHRIGRPGGAGSGRRRLAWLAGPAVALAAAILGIVWAGPWRSGTGARPPTAALVAGFSAGDAAVAPEGLSVEAPETGGVAVFATRNPDIHVVWFYEDRVSNEEDRQGER